MNFVNRVFLKITKVAHRYILKAKIMTWQLLLAVFFTISLIHSSSSEPQLYITVAAEDRLVELTFKGLEFSGIDSIIFTNKEPSKCTYNEKSEWTCDKGDVLYYFRPLSFISYMKTPIQYSFKGSGKLNKKTSCHTVWVVHVDKDQKIAASGCLRAYPRWINEMLPAIGNKRFRDLVIPGTHDSASYNNDLPLTALKLPIVKYILTQDDTILGQLYHGARYLDIRPSYYKRFPYKWYVNHGITVQKTMSNVLDQVIEFVKDTNEPVIFGMKEFPVGFKNKNVHRDFVKYVVDYLEDWVLKPPKNKDPWKTTINELMKSSKGRVILSYDHRDIVKEFPDVLFPRVLQYWGDENKWNGLEKYLRSVVSQDPT